MTRPSISIVISTTILSSAFMFTSTVSAADATHTDGLDQRQFEQSVAKAIVYLKTKGQSGDGSYSGQVGIGPTALVTVALLRNGLSVRDPQVAKSLKYLETFVQPDNGIHQPGTFFRNYETCLAILCFSEANQDGRYDQLIRKADAFVKGLQWDEDEGKNRSDVVYGGGGYGNHKRPDLSNTGFLIDALRAA